MTENEIAKIVVDCSFKIHTTIGPGLLESVYEEILFYELNQRTLKVERQKGIPVVYNELKMDLGFRADLIVENKVIIELKAVMGKMPKIFESQVISYLKASGIKVGLLVNFGNRSCELRRLMV